MYTLALIACSKSKLATTAPAGELYTGHLFQVQLAYARKVLGLGDHIHVLSARHGLVWINRVIEPYDTTLATMTAAERVNWSDNMALQLWNLGLSPILQPGGATIYLMAGKLYREPLEEWLCKWTWVNVVQPHPAGLGIGQQQRWYKEQIANAGH